MRKIFSLAFVFCLCLAPQAYAVGTYGFTLTTADDDNSPVFTLTNSGTQSSIVGFTMTIGHTGYNFDATYRYVLGDPLTSLDDGNWNSGTTGSGRYDMVGFTFAGLAAGDAFQFTANIDPDHYNSLVNFRHIFFGNGDRPNSVLTSTFADGTVLSLTMPENSIPTDGQYAYTFTTSAATPIPGAVWLLGSGIVGLVGLRHKMKA